MLLFIYLFLDATIGFANRSIIVSESVGSVRVFLSNISGMISVPFNVAITADRPDRTSGLCIIIIIIIIVVVVIIIIVIVVVVVFYF